MAIRQSQTSPTSSGILSRASQKLENFLFPCSERFDRLIEQNRAITKDARRAISESGDKILNAAQLSSIQGRR